VRKFAIAIAAVLILAPSVSAVHTPANGSRADRTTHSGTAARRCMTTKDFDVYAIPSGYDNETRDVFARGVPKHASNIAVHFVYRADGRPVKATPFPLQTWTAKVKGFRNGLLWVQIRFSGYGYGMPVATVSHWRALVSYDC